VRIRQVFSSAVERLRGAEIPEPETEAALLLGHLLKMNRAGLILAGDQEASPELASAFEALLIRRLAREPAAYILGEQEFWSLPFKVTPAVLVPRPETELLIELALRICAGQTEGCRGPVLDLGTGSGVRCCGVDRSFAALRVAAENAGRHGVRDRVEFINTDWFAGLAPGQGFELVLANPPYVARHLLTGDPGCEFPGPLAPEVVKYEPRLALDGGEGGMEIIRHLAGGLSAVLKPGGWFFMEIGADQAEEVLGVFRLQPGYGSLAVHKDYAGLPRVFQARRRAD
jgi:release factor glutamine methyltransferase